MVSDIKIMEAQKQSPILTIVVNILVNTQARIEYHLILTNTIPYIEGCLFVGVEFRSLYSKVNQLFNVKENYTTAFCHN